MAVAAPAAPTAAAASAASASALVGGSGGGCDGGCTWMPLRKTVISEKAFAELQSTQSYSFSQTTTTKAWRFGARATPSSAAVTHTATKTQETEAVGFSGTIEVILDVDLKYRLVEYMCGVCHRTSAPDRLLAIAKQLSHFAEENVAKALHSVGITDPLALHSVKPNTH